MGLVLFIIQVLALQTVLSYPAGDYIIAYIPVEEVALLNSLNIEVYPITSCDQDFVDESDAGPDIYIDESTYFEGPLTKAMRPIQGCPPFPMYLPAPFYQPLYTVTFLPPVFLPAPMSPCLPMPLPLPIRPISLPNQPLLPILPIDQCDVIENTEENVLPDYETVTGSVPVTGTVVFNGKLPVAGKINIYAKCF